MDRTTKIREKEITANNHFKHSENRAKKILDDLAGTNTLFCLALYIVHSLLFSLVVHCSQRSEDGFIAVFW
jgi:hypothetical protein